MACPIGHDFIPRQKVRGGPKSSDQLAFCSVGVLGREKSLRHETADSVALSGRDFSDPHGQIFMMCSR